VLDAVIGALTMALLVQCPNPKCGKPVSFSEELAGLTVHCHHCGTNFKTSGSDSGVDQAAAGAGGAEIPQQVGRFQIREVLGAGAFGTVYRAFDPNLDREVALKVPQSGTLESPQAIERFLREAKTAARLRHANIVPIYETGQHGNHPYIVFAFIEGRALSTLLDEGPVDFARTAEIVRSLADALAYAHAEGIVHRDVKPANVMVDKTGRPHLMDFGLAHRQDARTRLTRVGAVLGTPGYVAPEQARGQTGKPLPAGDQYSLGVVLYEMLCGRKPFEGPPEIVLFHAIQTPPAAPRSLNPALPAELEAICLKAMAKVPEDRFAGCAELMSALQAWLALNAATPRRASQPSPAVDEMVRAGPTPLAPVRNPPLVTAPDLLVHKPARWRGWTGYVLAGGAAALLLVGITLLLPPSDKAPPVTDPMPEPPPIVAPSPEVARFAELLKSGRQALTDARFGDAVKDLTEAGKLQPGHADVPGLLKQAREMRDFRRLLEEAHEFLEKRELEQAGGKLDEAAKLRLADPALQMARQELEEFWKRTRLQKQLLEKAQAFLPKREFEKAREQIKEAAKLDSAGPAVVKVCEELKQQEAAYDKVWQKAIDDWQAADRAWDAGRAPEEARTFLLGVADEFRGWEWRYLWRRFQPAKELQTLRGHTYRVQSVAFSPDGKRLACGVGTADQIVQLWDVTTGLKLLAFRGSGGAVHSVAFSPDGKRLATGSINNTVELWDTDTGQRLQSLKGHTALVRSVAFSPDGKRLASASDDGTVELWDAITGKELRAFRGHTNSVSSVVFSPDGKRLASASTDGTVRLWDPGKSVQILRGHKDLVYSVVFSPDGKRLASASITVKLWDATTGKEIQTLRRHTGSYVLSVAFSPEGRRLATGSLDKTVKLWDATTGEEIQTLRGHTGSVDSVAFSPDGKRLASSGRDKTVKLWDVSQRPQILRGHTGQVWSVSFSPDGKRLASGSWDKTVKLWDAMTGQELQTLSGHTGDAASVAFSPDAKRLASGSGDETVKLWDMSTGTQLKTLWGHSGAVKSVAFSPDGKRFVSGSSDETVKLWDATTGQALQTLSGHLRAVTSVTFSPDGKRFVSGSSDETVKLWDATTGQVLHTLSGHTGRVTSVAFSPDGKRLVSGSWGQTVKLWDVTSGQVLHTLNGHTGRVTSVAFSRDGKRLASGSSDKTIKLWDVRTGKELLTLRGHTDTIYGVAFSRDGALLASGSADQTIILWNGGALPAGVPGS